MKLSLEDFKWRGMDSKDQALHYTDGDRRMVFLDPVINKDHKIFEFSAEFDFYNHGGDYLIIGVCEKSHAEDCVFGEDGICWGLYSSHEYGSIWIQGERTIVRGKKLRGGSYREIHKNIGEFKDVDKVSVLVNRIKESIEFKKNGKRMVELTKVDLGNKIPDDLLIAVSVWKKMSVTITKFRVIQFIDYDPDLTERIEYLMEKDLSQESDHVENLKNTLKINIGDDFCTLRCYKFSFL